MNAALRTIDAIDEQLGIASVGIESLHEGKYRDKMLRDVVLLRETLAAARCFEHSVASKSTNIDWKFLRQQQAEARELCHAG